MDIRDLRFFCLTAELEHVTKAADKLGVAQPFLTKIIKQMESEVGTALFDNVGRKIRLNKYGEIVYYHGKKILAEMENLRDNLDSAIESQAYNIRVYTNGEFHYPELFLAYQIANSAYTLSITSTTRDGCLEALRTGEADFVLCSPPLPDDPEKGIVSEVIFREYPCVMLPPEHPLLKERKHFSMSDLKDMPLIATGKDTALRINVERYLEKYDLHPTIACETNDFGLILASVKSGLGYAILPRTLMFSKPSVRKYCLEPPTSDIYGEIGLSFSSTQSDTREGSNFANFTRTFVKNFYEKYYREGIEHLHPNED